MLECTPSRARCVGASSTPADSASHATGVDGRRRCVSFFGRLGEAVCGLTSLFVVVRVCATSPSRLSPPHAGAGVPNNAGASRLFRLAMASFEVRVMWVCLSYDVILCVPCCDHVCSQAAVRSTPDMSRIINHYGDVLAKMARMTSGA
jgi:hypothetical protein